MNRETVFEKINQLKEEKEICPLKNLTSDGWWKRVLHLESEIGENARQLVSQSDKHCVEDLAFIGEENQDVMIDNQFETCTNSLFRTFYFELFNFILNDFKGKEITLQEETSMTVQPSVDHFVLKDGQIAVLPRFIDVDEGNGPIQMENPEWREETNILGISLDILSEGCIGVYTETNIGIQEPEDPNLYSIRAGAKISFKWLNTNGLSVNFHKRSKDHFASGYNFK